jgi:hypothetical protein
VALVNQCTVALAEYHERIHWSADVLLVFGLERQ